MLACLATKDYVTALKLFTVVCYGWQGLLVLAVLSCYLRVLGCLYRQAKPILKRKIPSNNKPLRK